MSASPEKEGLPELLASKDPEEQEAPQDKDAPEDKRPTLGEDVRFLVEDTTPNVVPSDTGGLLMVLKDGGLKFLVAGARANVGIKAGRYMFETKIVEDTSDANVPSTRSFVRIGLSAGNGWPMLGESEESACFTTDGYFLHNRESVKLTTGGAVGQKAWTGVIVAVVVNLEQKGPNANTMTLFINGQRFAKPQPIPQSLRGKALFPTVTFRSVCVHVNFGPDEYSLLPFKCRMLQGAAKADVEIRNSKNPKGGKREVIFPVALPEQGGFDWLDHFIQQSPGFTELSDRKVLEWGSSSGLVRIKAHGPDKSGDKPGVHFGFSGLEDGSVQRTLTRFAALCPRDYVVMELKGNLEKETRAAALKRFSSKSYKRIAVVLLGEPGEAVKNRARAAILEKKQEILNKEHKVKMAAAAKARQTEMVRKRVQRIERDRKRKAEALQKAKERALKRARGEAVEEEEDAPEVEEPEEKEDEFEEPPPPQAELTDAEQSVWFKATQPSFPDISQAVLASSLKSFCLPDDSEGFDEIRYLWYPAKQAADHFKSWIVSNKKMMPIDHLTPSDWFKQKVEGWRKDFLRYQAMHKTAQAKKMSVKVDKSQENDTTAMMTAEMERLTRDCFAADDICDIGNGVPLFADFELRDWMLVNLRFELHAMVHSLKTDCDDPDRRQMSVDQVGFYYSKYFKKALNPKNYGFDNLELLLKFLEDTIYVDESGVLESQVEQDHASHDIFLKLAEETRRLVECRVMNGDEDVLKPAPVGNPKSLMVPGAVPLGVLPGGAHIPGAHITGDGASSPRVIPKKPSPVTPFAFLSQAKK